MHHVGLLNSFYKRTNEDGMLVSPMSFLRLILSDVRSSHLSIDKMNSWHASLVCGSALIAVY